jgi:hypothetical protein
MESESCDLENLNLAIRYYNVLRRGGIHTIRHLIKVINTGSINSVRHLGKTGYEEILMSVQMRFPDLDLFAKDLRLPLFDSNTVKSLFSGKDKSGTDDESHAVTPEIGITIESVIEKFQPKHPTAVHID